MDDVPEMVERVARAIAATGPFGHDLTEGEARQYAHAAIAAMREPTANMLSRGGYHCITGAGAVTEGDKRQAKAVYHAMIDRALVEEADYANLRALTAPASASERRS